MVNDQAIYDVSPKDSPECQKFIRQLETKVSGLMELMLALDKQFPELNLGQMILHNPKPRSSPSARLFDRRIPYATFGDFTKPVLKISCPLHHAGGQYSSSHDYILVEVNGSECKVVINNPSLALSDVLMSTIGSGIISHALQENLLDNYRAAMTALKRDIDHVRQSLRPEISEGHGGKVSLSFKV